MQLLCRPGDVDGERQLWQSAENSLNLKANDDKAKFDNKGNLGNANDLYSGGLLFWLCPHLKELPSGAL